MRKSIFFPALIFSLSTVNAQSLSPNVISSAGGVDKSSNIQLEWTLGETSVGFASTTNRFYTVGFHQPVLIVRTVLPENDQVDYRKKSETEETRIQKINVFPNPVNNTLHIQLDLIKYMNLKIILADLLGRTLLEKSINGITTTTDISVTHLISGVYQLRIYDSNGILIRTYKIIKAN